MTFKSKLLLNFAGVYLIWGSTYLAVKFAVDSFPPLVMGSIRYAVAGLILLGLGMMKGEGFPKPISWLKGLLLGFLMILCGQALVFMAATKLPSSVIALICSTVPVWVSLIDRFAGTKEKISVYSFTGMAMGLTGIFFLVSPGGSFNYLFMLPVLLSCIAWSAATVLTKKINKNDSGFNSIAVQMLAGSLMLSVTSIASGEYRSFNPEKVTFMGLASLSYLIIFGSVIVFSCYTWLLNNFDAGKVSTYAFVNPVIAVLLGWLAGGETLSLKVIISASIIILGVAVIITGKSLQKKVNNPVPERVSG